MAVEFASTLQVFDQANVKETRGVVDGQTLRPLIGCPDRPSERVRVAVANFKAGTHEHLHWHAIEVFYYVMAGSAIVRDYHGKEFPVHAGSAIYAPAVLLLLVVTVISATKGIPGATFMRDPVQVMGAPFSMGVSAIMASRSTSKTAFGSQL